MDATTHPIPACFICGEPLRVTLTHSKKGKVAVGLHCPTDGRHLRAFCNHRPFVEEVVARVGAQAPAAAAAGAAPAASAADAQALQKAAEGRKAAGTTRRSPRP